MMKLFRFLQRSQPASRSKFRTLLRIGGWFLMGGVALMLAAGLVSMPADAPATYIEPASGEVLVQGAAIFAERCAVCHGPNGAGNIGPALNGTAHSWHHADQDLRITIRDGIPRTQMKGHGEDLTQAEIDAVIAYFKRWWTLEEQEKQRRGSTSM